MIDGDNFKELKMYQCKWCGGIFHTTRHKCKFNPEYKNCLSCKHCIGFDDFKGQASDWRATGYQWEIEPYKIFLCDIDGMCDEPNVDLAELAMHSWKGFCDYYEIMPDYKGKSSYAEIIQQHRENDLTKFWMQEDM